MDKTKLKEMLTQIYSLTNDGKNLPPPILETVELAEGKYMNERGYEAIQGILALAEAGLYSNPTHGQDIRKLHDLEHITTDSEGYLYFKDKFVSRRSGDFESIFGKRKLEQLQSKCLFLERCKIGVTSFNVQFPFDFMKDAYNRDNGGDAGGDSIQFVIGENKYSKNGKEFPMDTAARIINNRTYIHIRIAGEFLNYEVIWQE